MKPLFSIITATYNAEHTLPPTLESIKQQSCQLFEHIIVDGASTDSTLSVAQSLGVEGIIIHSAPDKGVYDAMNRGLDMASGDYVMFLNAGDSLHSPNTLKLIADTIMENDYPGVVYGQTDVVDSSRRRLASRHLRAPEVLTLNSFKDGMVVCHQAFVTLRKLTSSYDLRYRLSADYDWCLRCLQRSRRNAYIDEVLIDYLNEGLSTHNRRRSLLERFRIMTHYFGLFPTLWRHIKFLPRYLKRCKLEKQF